MRLQVVSQLRTVLLQVCSTRLSGNIILTQPFYLAQLNQLRDFERPTTAVGQGAIYSDGGFALLGRVLERLTGLPYQEAVQKFVGKPLGLKSTTTTVPDRFFNSLIITAEMNGGATAWAYDNQLSAR